MGRSRIPDKDRAALVRLTRWYAIHLYSFAPVAVVGAFFGLVVAMTMPGLRSMAGGAWFFTGLVGLILVLIIVKSIRWARRHARLLFLIGMRARTLPLYRQARSATQGAGWQRSLFLRTAVTDIASQPVAALAFMSAIAAFRGIVPWIPTIILAAIFVSAQFLRLRDESIHDRHDRLLRECESLRAKGWLSRISFEG